MQDGQVLHHLPQIINQNHGFLNASAYAPLEQVREDLIVEGQSDQILLECATACHRVNLVCVGLCDADHVPVEKFLVLR